MGIYREDYEKITKEEAYGIAEGMILYHAEQLEESRRELATLLFFFRDDYGPDTFDDMVKYTLGMSKGEAQSYLNEGLTAAMEGGGDA